MGSTAASLADLRRSYHRALCSEVLGPRGSRTIDGCEMTIYSNADGGDDVSVVLAAATADELGGPYCASPPAGTAAGSRFERATRDFVTAALELVRRATPAELLVEGGRVISSFDQYAHLDEIKVRIEGDPQLRAALGGDYLVRPDIVVSRAPLPESAFGLRHGIVEGADRSPMRAVNSSRPLLVASISCKWTMRSDRAQNTRTEALNLVRNRKGRTPHVMAVTAEPLPARLASVAIGTGDIDCVYHVALPELLEAAASAPGHRHSDRRRRGRWQDALDQLAVMVDGRRLRDIADLPIDILA